MSQEKRVKFGNLENLVGPSYAYDVEKKKSSAVRIYPDEAILEKTKRRTLDKTLYEAYMVAFWNLMLDTYAQDQDIQLCAPTLLEFCYESEPNQLGYGTVRQMQMKGESLNAIQNTKEKIEFMNESFRVGSVIGYLAGALTKIKDVERVLHRDYNLRHLLFDKGSTMLAPIDVENSRRMKKPWDVIEENDTLKGQILARFNHKEAAKLFEYSYEKIKSIDCADQIMKAAGKKLCEITENPHIRIDPFKQKVYYE